MLCDFETRYQWIRDRHDALRREAEIERQLARSAYRPSLRARFAAVLRGLADRLDPEARYGQSHPFVTGHVIQSTNLDERIAG